jgi:predicted AAA+ superfamily ATPase
MCTAMWCVRSWPEGIKTRIWIPEINLADLTWNVKIVRMISRLVQPKILNALSRQAAVALIGPRQIGKTTLALLIAEKSNSLYLDLENPRDLAKLADPVAFLQQHENKLVILDEIHRLPGLFPVLRGIIDRGRRKGIRVNRFLLLGSASLDLLRQSGESLAGRITFLDMTPLSILEVKNNARDALWLRGGFPDSYLATDDSESFSWREDLIRTYLERDIPMFGPRIPAETLRRFWTMLAHGHGGLHNSSKIASSLEVSSPTVHRYTDLLVDLLLLRRLVPFHINTKKRLVKSPKVFVRDSGLLHALLQISALDDLLAHPVVGGSWEGFVIENLINSAPTRTVAGFYRTSGGAEIDLVLQLPGGKIWAIEIKKNPANSPSRGFYEACQDINPARKFLVHSGEGIFPLNSDVESVGCHHLANLLADASV